MRTHSECSSRPSPGEDSYRVDRLGVRWYGQTDRSGDRTTTTVRNMAENDLVGIHEIAKMGGVSSQAVSNWRKRYLNFPPPIVELRMGPIFKRPRIKAWLYEHDRRSGKTKS